MNINVMLIIVIAVIAVLTIWGAHRGLRGVLFGILAWVFAVGFVSWMMPKVEDFLTNSTYQEWVYEHVESHIREKVDAQMEEKEEPSLQDIVDGLELPILTQVVGIAEQRVHETAEEAKEAVIQAVTGELTKRIVNATAMMVSLLMAVAICLVMSLLLRVIHELPVVGGISRFIGGVWGFIEGILAVWVLFVLVTSLASSELGQKAMEQIMNNPILLYLYENNLILSVVNLIRNAIGA